MKRYLIVITIALSAAGTMAAGKSTPNVVRLSDVEPVTISTLYKTPALRTADTCTVYMAGDPFYYIYPWVVGDELYKAYQDPAQTCERPYPFTVDVVYVLLYYLETDTIYISVDIETADLTEPTCPRPGSLIVISPLYEISLDSNLYLIQIPLLTPAVVNSPYFVGLYFADMGNPTAAAVIIDTFPAPCVSYNDWGEGYVDLDTVTNQIGGKVFKGRLILYSGGITGGSGGPDPAPAAQIIHPVSGQFLGTWIDLWANDAAGSRSIDRARFQFFNGGSWYDIGYDAEDDPPFRNGVDPSGDGNGLAYLWNTTGISEDDYQLRVIVVDTLGRADTAGVTAHIDPTPPFPTINQPVVGQNVCNGASVQVTCSDEDLVYISFDRKSIPMDFSVPISLVDQQLGGDNNDDPGDGNLVANGEFGDYCSGPAAGAMMIKLWYDRGFPYLLQEASTFINDTLLMDRLFNAMNIRENQGAYDEEVIGGLKAYIIAHYDWFNIPIDRSPTLAELFSWMGDYEYAVMVGISGDPGFWMTAAGSVGMNDPNGYATLKMADPVSAAVGAFSVKQDAGELWILYDAVWREIDILVGMVARNWSVTRKPVGVDAIGIDGWGIEWDTQTLPEDSLYFLSASAYDMVGNTGIASVLIQNDCSVDGIPGDINHDGVVNAADVVYMTNFLYLNGPPPPGGYDVVDVNCDGFINLSDLIYLFNYLYNSGPAPCP